jgi:hypothetical protein
MMQEWRSALGQDAATADEPADVSNGSTEPPAPASASAPDDEPAPATTEGVSASDAPAPGEGTEPPAAATEQPADRPPSRREQERLDHEQEIAALKAKVSEYEAPDYRDRVRQEVLAEQARAATSDQEIATARADAERFARLNATPDAELSGEDYQWREERKELIRRYPEAETAIRAEAERFIQEQLAAAKRTVDQGWSGIQTDIVAQIQASEKLPNVDKSAFQAPGVTWQQMAEQIHAAGAAWKDGQLAETVTKAEARATAAEAESARVAKENGELRAQIAGDRRAPAVIGRTAGAESGVDVFDPSQGWRGNLHAALTANGTG